MKVSRLSTCVDSAVLYDVMMFVWHSGASKHCWALNMALMVVIREVSRYRMNGALYKLIFVTLEHSSMYELDCGTQRHATTSVISVIMSQ